MTKKDKLVVLNATIPESQKAFLEVKSKEENHSSISDYIRALIRKEMQESKKDDMQLILGTITNYLSKLPIREENMKVSSKDNLEIFTEKLKTITYLFEQGLNLKRSKIKSKRATISDRELTTKLNAWAKSHSYSEEVAGLFEKSEKRKKSFLNG